MFLPVIRPLLVGALLVSCAASAHEFSGYLGLEGRLFWRDPVFPEQADNNASITSEIEYYHDFDDYSQRIAFTGFARADSEDSERSHADVRELYWWKQFGGFEVYAGVRKIFWGVTESIHLVDIVNQTDTLENIDGEDKLGQPMIQLVTAQGWGTVSAFVMPVFREREFPGEESRLRFGLPISDDPLYQDDDEDEHIDLAIRYSHYIDIWDFGLSHFSGTSREPFFIVSQEPGQLPVITPQYRQLDQTGLDVQATIGAWLYKLEVISMKDDDFGRNTALAGGIEYTLFTILGSNADLGIVAEYQFDDRRGIRESVGQNDVVLGARLAFNDIDGSEVLVLFTQDLDRSNRFFSVEASRRLGEKWRLEGEVRIFSSAEPDSIEFNFRDDDYFQVELRRYF